MLAGGQSLLPMLNFRLVEPQLLVDINRIDGLAGITAPEKGRIRIGALTRHRSLETSPLLRDRFPVLAEAITHVAHLAIRNRGTIGGSLTHADPAAELPALALLLDAEIELEGPFGSRTVKAGEFFLAPLVSQVGEEEMLISVEFPELPPGSVWGFREVARRRGDFAVAGAAAILHLQNGVVSTARISLFGVHDTPLRPPKAEAVLVGMRPDRDVVAEAAKAAREAVTPMNDLHGSADYRRHLTEILTAHVLEAAIARARMEMVA